MLDQKIIACKSILWDQKKVWQCYLKTNEHDDDDN